MVSGLEGSETQSLKDFAVENDLADIVEFIKPYDPDNVIEFYKAIDIYVSCSLSDGGLSSSTAEAMSCGLVVVSANNSENHLWIKDGVNGYLFSDSSEIQLAQILEDISKTYSSLAALRANARDTIVKRNSLESEMGKVSTFYRSLVVHDEYF